MGSLCDKFYHHHKRNNIMDMLDTYERISLLLNQHNIDQD